MIRFKNREEKNVDQLRVDLKPYIKDIIDLEKFTKKQSDEIIIYIESQIENSVDENVLITSLKTINKMEIDKNIYLYSMNGPMSDFESDLNIQISKDDIKKDVNFSIMVSTLQLNKKLDKTSSLSNNDEIVSDMVSDNFNKQFKEGKNYLFLYRLVESVTIIAEGTFAPKLMIKSRFHLSTENEIKDKLKITKTITF